MTNTLNLRPDKQYYDVLDGLRGTAAIVILIFHYLETVYTYSDNVLGHGFLAVDFFFCLSGFVIGFAYDHRIKTMGMRKFCKNRLIRLHPLILLGTIVGLIGYLSDPFVNNALAPSWYLILIAVIGSALLIPTPILPFRYGALFPYNSPAWSLFLEYIINIFYGVVLSRTGKKMLLFLLALSSGWFIYSGSQAGGYINGWDARTWYDGLPRVFFSFIAGLVVFRFKIIWKHKFGFFLPLLLLLGVFMFPHHKNDWITESICVILIFPLILCLGAGATVTGFVRKACLFIGQLSYPLYMTHISTVWIFGNYYQTMKPEGIKLYAIIATLCIFNIVFAYLVMKFYDEPVRRWLTNRLKGK